MDAFDNKSMQAASTIFSDDNSVESCNGFIQKEHLFQLVNYESHANSVDFAWGSEILAEKISFTALKIKEQGESFRIPVSLQNIAILKELSDCKSSLKHTEEIDVSKVCGSTLEDLNLSSLVVHNLQLPTEMKITAKFTKLMMYNGEKGCLHNLGSCWVEGKFGIATLQLPVEGGHEGGSLNVEYRGRKKRFESHESSDANFYLSAFYDNCEHFIEPVLRGYKLIVVYDLIWTNATTGVPKNFPVFLGAMKKIKESLKPWLIRYQLLNSKMEIEKPGNSKEELKDLNAAIPEFYQDLSEVIKCPKIEPDILIAERTLKENVFLFVLQKNYEEEILAFELLQEQDRVVADLLLNCDFLDVHLAMAIHSSMNSRKKIIDGKDDFIEISRVIDSDDVTRNLSIELQWDKNYVGLVPSDQKKKIPEEIYQDSTEAGKKNLNHGVLLIWPKHHSVQMYCRYGLHSLLIRMSKSLKSMTKCNEEARFKALGDLRQLVSYCCAEPRKVWTKSGMKKGELTIRLLHFCIALRARKEGLDLLKNLGSNFDDAEDTENFEGIKTEDVALAIAKFECQVCGWYEIAESIKAMITPGRIAKQLVPITKLAKFFLAVNCIEGAKTVSDRISSFFVEIDSNRARKLKCCDVEAFVDMLVALESNPESSSRKRITSFFLFFSNLRPSLQCHLLLNFESQHGSRLKTIHSWQFIYRDVCAVFSESSNICSPPLKCMAVDFMKTIKIWLSDLAEEAKLRVELQESIRRNDDATDPVLEQMVTVSVSSKSNVPSFKLNPDGDASTTDWVDASDSLASTKSNKIPAAESETKSISGIVCSNDWCGKTDSQTMDLKVKESASSISKSVDDWDLCADSWKSSNKKTGNDEKTVANDEQSSWDVPLNMPSNKSFRSYDDWNSWTSTSNSTTPKSNVVSTSGLKDDWSTSTDAWGSSKGITTGTSQSDPWGSTETVKNSWTGGYNPFKGGRGGGRTPLRPCFRCNEEGHMSYNCPNDPNRGRGGGRGGSGRSIRACYKCNEEGHMSYNCPTGPTRGRQGGRVGGVSTRPCFKCKQDGHSSYNCPNASNGGARNSPASTYGAPNSSTSVAVFDDWGTLTVTPSARSSNSDSGEKKDDWGSSSGSASSSWTTGVNAAPRGSRNTPRSSYNAPIGNAQPAVDDWGISSNQSTVPVVKTSVNRTTTGDSVADDWGAAADAWSSVKTSKPTPRSGNSIVDKASGDNWGAVTDSWEDRSSMSNAERCPTTNSKIFHNGPSAIGETNDDDWGIAADISKSSLVSNVRTIPSLPQMDEWNVTGPRKSDANLIKSSEELNQSRINSNFWNGTINHGRRSFKTNMKHLDKNSSPVLADLEMPKSMRVVGTIEPEKVWTYLKRVRETISERICVFEFSPSSTAEMDGYKFFFDELHGMNWFAVIADAPDSKLPWNFKDFYVLPLAKDTQVPFELTTFVKKTVAENWTSDLFLGVVVFRAQRSVDQSSSIPSLPKTPSITVTQGEVEPESIKIPKSNSSESSLVASAQPTRMTAIRQKLQQDILNVDPVKAKVHANSPQLFSKSTLSRQPPVAKSYLAISEKASPLVAESNEEKIPVVSVLFNPGKPPVDGEMLMQKAILEELSRQIGKHGKSTEVSSTSSLETTTSSVSLSGIEPPCTRSRSKRKPVVEESSASKRAKKVFPSNNSNLPMMFTEKETETVHISSRKSSNPSLSERGQCVMDGCSIEAQANSVYCSDECIASHVRDSLNAMSEKLKSSQLQEPQSPINLLTPPNTSSDESLWKDSVDYTMLMNQPTPALASKLLAITQRRKSLSTGGAKPSNLADDTPVPVMERKTGKVLCGPSAPKVSSVEQWLKDNATYSIIKPESLSAQPWLSNPSTPSMTSSSKVNVLKTSPVHPPSTSPTAAFSKPKVDSHSSKKPNDLSSSKAKVTRKRSTEANKEETPTKVAKSDPESTRSISRNSLKEALWSRCKEANDLETDEAIVEQVATEIEDSLFSFFKKDVGAKYKNKYRSLIYNMKDPKNPELFREVITKQILPDELVKMSTEDLAYKDLAEWREKEAKRQLDLIEKNEQEIMGLANRYLIKTHKGEEIIEDVCKEVDDREEVSSKMNITQSSLSELPNERALEQKPQRLNRSRNRHSIKEKERNDSTTTRSNIEKCDKKSSRSLKSSKSSRRFSDSSDKRSYHHRSDRDKKKDTKERDRHRSSKSRDQHHSNNSDRDKKREHGKKKDIPEKSNKIKKAVVGDQLYDPSHPLNSDDEELISTAPEGEVSLQQKLLKQQAVLEELDRHNESPKTQRSVELVVNSVVAKSDDTAMPKFSEPTTSFKETSRSEERQYRLLTDYSDDENGEQKRPKETVVLDVDMNRHHDLEMESDPAVAAVGCEINNFAAQDEENVLYSPGKLLIAEDDESILDLDEQLLKEQVVIEELNSNLTSFLVNNMHIQSHDAELDANTSSEMVTINVNETDVPKPTEPSTSTVLSCMDSSSLSSSTDPVPDHSTRSTSSCHLEDSIAAAKQEEH